MPPTCFRNLRELNVMLCFPFIFFLLFCSCDFQDRTGQATPDTSTAICQSPPLVVYFVICKVARRNILISCTAEVRGQWKRCGTAAGRMAKAATRSVNGETKAKKLSTDCFTYSPFNCAVFAISYRSGCNLFLASSVYI